MENRPPMMEQHHMHGISTTHSEHDKYSMVLACFIVTLIFLMIIIVLLGMSAHRQGSMLNNSNNAMTQINSLKKDFLAAKGAQRAGLTMPQPRKGGFSNGLMGNNGARPVGSYIKDISPMNWGSDAGSRLTQTSQGGDNIITGQGLKGTISGDCGNNGTCGAYDNYMTYSTGGTGSMPVSSIAAAAEAEGKLELDFFQATGVIADDISVAKTDMQNRRMDVQNQRANIQNSRANMTPRMPPRGMN